MFSKKNSIYTLALLGVLLLGSSFYIQAKALVAQELIAHAWEQVKKDQNPKVAKPWPWADTYPVAKLSANDLSLYVLDSHSGEALAFGPGHHSKTALPGNVGDSIIAGHRDTHFSFLKDLHVGDIIEAENYQGGIQEYLILEIDVIDASKEEIQVHNTENRLQLITCYPFDSMDTGGSLRYVVTAYQVISP